jgi:hypothetical protein
VQQDAAQEQDGTSVLCQLKPKISHNADHKLDDARPIKETNELVLQSKKTNELYLSIHPLTKGIYCCGATWSLGLYGQRNYLLTPIRDSKDTRRDDKQVFHTTSLRVFSFPCCYAFPTERSAIWHAFIPSTVGVS